VEIRSRPYRLAIVTTHVIQYQDPFFRLLAAQPGIDLTVYFCSRAGAEDYRDADLATTLRWDLPTLGGYRHRFLRGLTRSVTRGGFWRAFNPGILTALRRRRQDAVLFMTGWGVATAWLGFAACRLRGIPILLYGDSSFVPEASGFRERLRSFALRRLFRGTSAFMISGALNSDYYLHYGADPHRFFPLPWAIDNDRFERDSRFAPGERQAMRSRFGFEPHHLVAVFSGKLIPRKDPLLLLQALERMAERERAAVLYLGDGELRGALEEFARSRGLANVRFAGFVNQTELPKHYALGDVFVLPSYDDPRATVVNEAMACGLPVIVSDRCGPVGDLARHDENAFVVKAGDAVGLAGRLEQLMKDPRLRARMAARSGELISTWSYGAGIDGIRSMLGSLATVPKRTPIP
jgi:glycosyltransferase involved in cell wall biosynthesis